MANLKDVIYLSNSDYYTLATTGTVTIDGETLTYNENNLYITPDELASSTQDGLMSASDKVKLDGIDLSKYLLLTGGTISADTVPILTLKRTAASSASLLDFKNNNQDVNIWRVGVTYDNIFRIRYSSDGGVNVPNLFQFTNAGNIILINNSGIKGYDSSGTSRNIITSTSGNLLYLGGAGWNSIQSYNSIIPNTTNVKNLGTDNLQWNNIYGKTLYENGTLLSNKYLGISAKAADADKLDGNDSTYYLNYNNLTNKPTNATQSTAGLMSSTDKTKLDGIATGAEVNVQPDWNQTDTTADDYIKNKPTIGGLTVDSDVSEERISVPSTMKILKVMVPISWNADGDGGTDVNLYIHFSNGGANYTNVQATSTGREIHYCTYKEFEITKGYQNSSGRYYLVKVIEHDDEEPKDQISTYNLYTTGYIDHFYIDPNLAENTFDDDQVQVYYQIFE